MNSVGEILIADEPSVAEVMGEVLSRAGHSVQLASTRAETFDRAADRCPDLLLVALDLDPFRSGRDVALELKHRCPALRKLLEEITIGVWQLLVLYYLEELG